MSEPLILFQGQRFRVEQLIQTTPDGIEHAKQIVRHPGAVALLPLLDDGRVCLVQKLSRVGGPDVDRIAGRHAGAGRGPGRGGRGVSWPKKPAIVPPASEHLATFYMSPGILDERMHLYLATGLVPGPMSLDAGEDIRPLSVTLPEALAMVRDGRIRDAKSMLGLLYYCGTGK